jgi:hypothetical protein
MLGLRCPCLRLTIGLEPSLKPLLYSRNCILALTNTCLLTNFRRCYKQLPLYGEEPSNRSRRLLTTTLPTCLLSGYRRTPAMQKQRSCSLHKTTLRLKISRMFGDINKERTAERSLQKLKQKGVAIAYATEF